MTKKRGKPKFGTLKGKVEISLNAFEVMTLLSLDEDVLEHYQKWADEYGRTLDDTINESLREHMKAAELEGMIRRAVRDEIADAQLKEANAISLRMTPSLRKLAEKHAAKEGVSLNEFINLVLVEKLAHLEHEEWLASRAKSTPESRAKALAYFDPASGKRKMRSKRGGKA